MTAVALITGAIFKAPERRTSKAGKPFVVTTVRVVDGNNNDYWNILAFAEAAQADLMRLEFGDRLSAQGTLQVELYTGKDGQQRISRTLLTDHVLTLRQPRSKRHAEHDDTGDGACPGATP
jgi:single-stranded DNA-binding protein